jgi:hypothetical protein
VAQCEIRSFQRLVRDFLLERLNLSAFCEKYWHYYLLVRQHCGSLQYFRLSTGVAGQFRNPTRSCETKFFLVILFLSNRTFAPGQARKKKKNARNFHSRSTVLVPPYQSPSPPGGRSCFAELRTSSSTDLCCVVICVVFPLPLFGLPIINELYIVVVYIGSLRSAFVRIAYSDNVLDIGLKMHVELLLILLQINCQVHSSDVILLCWAGFTLARTVMIAWGKSGLNHGLISKFAIQPYSVHGHYALRILGITSRPPCCTEPQLA